MSRAQTVPSVQLTAKRFLRGENTLVDGFCRIRFGFLEPVDAAGMEGAGAYRMEVVVRDAGGLVLHESDWSQTVTAEFLSLAGASTVEHFSFAVPEGSYTITVGVTDSASGRVQHASTEVTALERAAQASDLLLTGAMRRASEGGGAAAPGEIQKGALFLTANTRPVLTPRQSELHYYLELYPKERASVVLSARVLSEQGSPVTATAPEELSVGAAGGVAARTVSLGGLPEGSYRLEVSAHFPEDTVIREAAFGMRGFETETTVAEVARARAQQDPFAEMTEDRLDSLYAPLVYIMEGDERGIYPSLSIDGKRNYMSEFWSKRDPTPETPENEYRVSYYQLFEEASRRFRESGAGDVPGWRTDRGRIFLKRGEPEAVLRRPQAGPTPPYEVWKYTRPRQLKYVFLDETGLGNYALIYTDDRFETGRPDWERLLGREAVEDVLRF